MQYKLILFVGALILFSCKKEPIILTENVTSATNHKKSYTDYDFSPLLHCNEYAWNEEYFFTPDYGCLYSPKSDNEFGNIIFYLIPKSNNQNFEALNVNSLTEKNIKNQFNIIVTLIEPQYLNYNPNADPIYYKKEDYWQKIFKYGEKDNKWILIDSLSGRNSKKVQNIIDSLVIPKKYQEETFKVQKTSEGYQLDVSANNLEIIKIIDCDSIVLNKQDKSYMIDLFYKDRYGNEWKKVKVPVEKDSQSFFVKKIFVNEYGVSAKTGDYEWFEKEVEVNQDLEDFDFNQIE